MKRLEFKQLIKECINEIYRTDNPLYSKRNVNQALGDIGELSGWEWRGLLNRAQTSGKTKTYDAHGLQWDNNINNILAMQYIDEHPELFK